MAVGSMLRNRVHVASAGSLKKTLRPLHEALSRQKQLLLLVRTAL